MPAPASPLGIFKPTLDPTAHAIPDHRGLFWRQIGHDQPHLLRALIPARKPRALQAAGLLGKAIHLAAPGSAYAGRRASETAKRACPFRTEMALFVDTHERMPAKLHDLAIQPRRIQGQGQSRLISRPPR